MQILRILVTTAIILALVAYYIYRSEQALLQSDPFLNEPVHVRPIAPVPPYTLISTMPLANRAHLLLLSNSSSSSFISRTFLVNDSVAQQFVIKCYDQEHEVALKPLLQLSHAALVKFYAIVSSEKLPFVQREHLNGQSKLTCMVKEYCGTGDAVQIITRRKISEKRLQTWVGDFLEALEYVSSDNDLMHWNVKPTNLLFTSDGNAKLDMDVPGVIVNDIDKQKTAQAAPEATDAAAKQQQHLHKLLQYTRGDYYWPPEFFAKKRQEVFATMTPAQLKKPDTFAMGTSLYFLVMERAPAFSKKKASRSINDEEEAPATADEVEPLGKALLREASKSIHPLFQHDLWSVIWYIRETIETYMLQANVNERETAKKTVRHYRLAEVLILPKRYYNTFIAFGFLVIGSFLIMNNMDKKKETEEMQKHQQKNVKKSQ